MLVMLRGVFGGDEALQARQLLEKLQEDPSDKVMTMMDLGP